MKIERLLLLRISQLLLFVGPTTTYAVSPVLNYDAISLPKVLVLSSIAISIFFLMATKANFIIALVEKNFFYACILFILCMFSTLLFSGAPLDQQIWGSFGRNTGFVTYVSLLFILFAAAIIQDPDFYKKLIKVFIYSSIPVIGYCLIQISGNDPIGWSEKRTFATLGNVNFLSAYLGLVSISALALLLQKGTSSVNRLVLLSIIFFALPIIASTNSIQGIMVFAAGSFVCVGFLIVSREKLRLLKVPYLVFSALSLVLTVMALFNSGPLARFIFQTSIILRGDYMHAGWEMTLKRPFFGVGMDSYGDWYREARGVITTLRGSPERTANSAHSIFLDISSNGGFPLLLAYLLIIFLALAKFLKAVRLTRSYDPILVALFATWSGYQVQALVSINQIGVGVWGWIFTGALFGYSKYLVSAHSDLQKDVKTKTPSLALYKDTKKLKSSLLPPLISLIGVTGFVLGALVSVIPLNADIAYKKSLQTQSIEAMTQASERLGSTAFHRALVLESAVRSNLSEQAGNIVLTLIDRYPRDYYGWRILALISPQGSVERSNAIDQMVKLDPFNKESLPSR